MTVRYDTDGAVAIVTIDRPEVRNAVDGPTRGCSPTRSAASTPTTRSTSPCSPAPAARSAPAPTSRRCPTGGGNRVGARRRRPDGPDAHAARQAGHRRGRGPRRRRRPRARAVVRPARRRARRGVRRVLPALGRAADRRRHHPPAAADRPQPRARPDPHRARRVGRRGAVAWASRTASPNPARRSPARVALAHDLAVAFRSAACAAIARRRTSSGRSIWTRRCGEETVARPRGRSAPARRRPAPAGSPPAPAATATFRRSEADGWHEARRGAGGCRKRRRSDVFKYMRMRRIRLWREPV